MVILLNFASYKFGSEILIRGFVQFINNTYECRLENLELDLESRIQNLESGNRSGTETRTGTGLRTRKVDDVQLFYFRSKR